MKWSGCAKFLVGFILAIAILIGCGALVGTYFMYRLSKPPEKPTFANDQPQPSPEASPSSSEKPSPSPTASPSPSPSPSPSEDTLEAGQYKARVTWSDGLVVRGEPNLEANRVGGVEHNQTIVVLEDSADGKWQRVRSEDGNLEGWVKAGNSAKLDE